MFHLKQTLVPPHPYKKPTLAPPSKEKIASLFIAYYLVSLVVNISCPKYVHPQFPLTLIPQSMSVGFYWGKLLVLIRHNVDGRKPNFQLDQVIIFGGNL